MCFQFGCQHSRPRHQNSCLFSFGSLISVCFRNQRVISGGEALWNLLNYFRLHRVSTQPLWKLKQCTYFHTRDIHRDFIIQKGLKVGAWSCFWLDFSFVRIFLRRLWKEISCISNAQNGVNIKEITLNVYSCMSWFPNDVDIRLLKVIILYDNHWAVWAHKKPGNQSVRRQIVSQI